VYVCYYGRFIFQFRGNFCKWGIYSRTDTTKSMVSIDGRSEVKQKRRKSSSPIFIEITTRQHAKSAIYYRYYLCFVMFFWYDRKIKNKNPSPKSKFVFFDYRIYAVQPRAKKLDLPYFYTFGSWFIRVTTP